MAILRVEVLTRMGVPVAVGQLHGHAKLALLVAERVAAAAAPHRVELVDEQDACGMTP